MPNCTWHEAMGLENEGWRLPSLLEILAAEESGLIANKTTGKSSGAVGWYWTRSEVKNCEASFAFSVRLSDSEIDKSLKTNNMNYVRLVRNV